ncbi:MAG TPA: ABC transporter permease [Anaeromyxobacteraceae bacterium]|nr:ABC transporter permease [Anaeromyxobacteraceae bacterium]
MSPAPSPSRPSPRVQLAAVFRKEVGQTVRDRRVMFLLMVAPLVQTVVFGFAVDFEVDRVPTVVADADGSLESREHARRLLADRTLLAAGAAASPAEAERAIDRGDAAAALVLPRRLGADLAAGRPARVQVLLDGTDPNRANVAGAAASRYFGELGERMARERLAARGVPEPPRIDLVPRLLYNPELRTPPFMVPGIAAMLLVIVTTLTSAMGLAREREMGTLEQVLVTPISPLLLLVGKMAPFVVIGLVDVMLLVGVGTWLFDIPIRGNPAVFLVGTLVYLMTTLGVGLLISTVSSTQQQAFLGGFLFAIPAIILSGVMTPIRAMPQWLQLVTRLNPLRYFVEVMRGVLLRGAGFAELWPQLAALLVLGSLILAVATRRFHKRLA